MLKCVHYINQFFAGIGGEEKADYQPELRKGVVGPGAAMNAAFKGEAEIVATVICGDSYFNENEKTALATVLDMIKSENPDFVVCGPTFNAGRYGVACGTVANAVKEQLNLPVVTGMYEENPGADMFKTKVYIVPTKNNAAGMGEAVKYMAPLALKLAKGEKLGVSSQEHYMPNGIRTNFFDEKPGAERAVDMLIAKLAGKPFTTEYPMPSFDRVEPGPAITDMKHARIALVTSGGIVPKGNPDHIESSNAQKYGSYCIEGVDTLDGLTMRLLTADMTRPMQTRTRTALFRLTYCARWRRTAKSDPFIRISIPQLVTVLQLLPQRSTALRLDRSSSTIMLMQLF